MLIIAIIVVVFLSVLFIGLNQLLIRKFYWGPTGKPPRYRSHERKQNDQSE